MTVSFTDNWPYGIFCNESFHLLFLITRMPLAEDFVAMECLIGCHNHQSSTSPTPWKWSMRWMRMATLPGDIDSVLTTKLLCLHLKERIVKKSSGQTTTSLQACLTLLEGKTSQVTFDIFIIFLSSDSTKTTMACWISLPSFGALWPRPLLIETLSLGMRS